MRVFAYRLAQELGYANVDQMLDEMDAGQIAEWQAFDRIQGEANKRAELASKAEAGVRNYRRKGR